MAGELNPSAAAAVAAGSPTKNTATAIPGLVPKRQRRPSVRLGDIGGDIYTKPSSSSSKSRPLTNLLVNHNNNNNNHHFDNRKSAKRPRTNFIRKDDQGAYHHHHHNNNNNNEFDYEVEEEEPAGDEQVEEEEEDVEQRSPLTVHSGDDGFFQSWPPNTTNTNARVSDLGSRPLDVGVRKWLLHLGLSRYSPLFQIHEVDDDVLPHLTLDDLKDMGITAVGSRRKLYQAILNLRKGLS